jgi:hypothetical protein
MNIHEYGQSGGEKLMLRNLERDSCPFVFIRG